MSSHVVLVGADDVSRAGSRMQSAAEDMQLAASSIDEALARQRRFLDDWLDRLNATLADRISDLGQTLGPLA